MNLPRSAIRLEQPVVSGNSVEFRWQADDDGGFYREPSFTIEFPESVDASAVPPGIWLRVMLISMYPHWALMRPRRVELPRQLPPGEREFWLRAIDAAVWSLEIDADDDRPFIERSRRSIELIERGEPVEPLTPVTPSGIVAACFSGGRDSLTQTALLQELGEEPLLVTVTSSREGSREFETARRRSVLSTMIERRGLELVEVSSSFRSCVNNFNPAAARCSVGVTEVCDTLHYFAIAWAVGFARGADAVLLASETEMQESVVRDGMIVQHRHFMYSAATQRAMRALIAPTGIDHSGLTYPLLQFQIQRLLGQRYTELRDLQYSCWEQRDGEDVCSRCRECFGVALNMISNGVSPAEIGIDINQLLPAQSSWRPGGRPEAPRGTVGSHAGRYGDAQMLRSLRAATPDDVERLTPGGRFTGEARAALDQLSAMAKAQPEPGPEPGYRDGFLDLTIPRLRDGLRSIFAEHFDPEPPESYQPLLDRTIAIGDWIAAPLGEPPAPAATAPAPRSRRPRGAEPSPAQLAEIAALIPAPEPELTAPEGERILPIADTDLSGDELALVTQAVESNWVSSAGPYVEQLESEFAEFCGARHAVATSSGASALEVMLRAGGVGPGDEVIMPSFTMVATANAAHHAGAKVVFVDSDLATWNMDLERVAQAIGPRTKAIVSMHTYGHPVDMDALERIAADNSLLLFEDAAEAHGGSVRGRRVGSFGDAAAFSFYGNKIITTGEGGIITTSDAELAALARSLRSHAFSEDRHFWHRHRAHNLRMSNLQAAIGVAQLARIEQFLDQRRNLARMYREQLAGVPGIALPPVEEGFEDANWMFGVMVGDDFGCSRDELRRRLAAQGVETRTFFIPLHVQPAYIDEFDGRRMPGAEALGRQGLYLPSALWMTEADVARVAAVFAQVAAAEGRSGASPSPA